MPESYKNIEEFYAENEERRRSGEADYGVWWTEPGHSWPHWRVSYIQKTGEVYAVQLDGVGSSGKVELLGIVQADENSIYYQTLDRILAGWADICGGPGSLDWIRAKLAS